MANLILYAIPFMASMWLLTTLYRLYFDPRNQKNKFGVVVAGIIFIALMLVWWWATITVVGPIF